MKHKTSSSNSNRCQHRTPAGRQCRLPACDLQSNLCARHAAMQPPKPRMDYAAFLTHESFGFQNSGGINFSLGALYTLLAQDLISPRRAAVLAYISSLLLRTLPAMDTDRFRKATKPLPFAVPPGLSAASVSPFPPPAAAPETSDTPTSSEASPANLASEERFSEEHVEDFDAVVAGLPEIDPAGNDAHVKPAPKPN